MPKSLPVARRAAASSTARPACAAGYQLHISIGAAALDCRNGIKASIALADQRMYEHKRSKLRRGA